MKIPKTVFALLTTLALSACNNNNEVLDSYNDNLESTLDVTIKLPEMNSQLTRGVIIGNDDITQPPAVVVKSIYITIRDDRGLTVTSTTLKDDKINIVDNKITAQLKSTKITPVGKAFAVVHYDKAGLTTIKIADLQPTDTDGERGVENAVYATDLQPIVPIPGRENQYTASLTATSIVARTEVLGKSKFNPRLIYSMDLAFVSPVNYHLIYDIKGAQVITKSKDLKNILGLGATQMEANGTLLDKNGTAFDLNTLAAVNEGLTGNKANGAVVNHLFAGDVTKMHIGFLIKKFDLVVNNEGSYLGATTDTISYVYKGKDDGTLYAFTKSGKAKVVTINTDGKAVVSGPELDKTREDMKIITNLRFFTLANFGRANHTGVYEGGVNYIINLGKLKWNGTNGYDPETHPGREDPDDNDIISTVNVDIQFKPWENHNPEITPGDYN